MDNPSQYLLSLPKIKKIRLQQEDWERQLKIALDKYYYYAKWKDNYWMIKLLRTTKQEMWSNALKYAPIIEWLELDIAECKQKLNNHYLAIELLADSNCNYEGINLREHSLKQQSLF